MRGEKLRLALLAGTLGSGGAEKQLVYMATSLQQVGVTLRVYCLTRGEKHERSLATLGLTPVWVGRTAIPVFRLISFARRVRAFRPHVVHSTHFYTNLYAALAARVCGAMSVGSVRSDGRRELGFHPVLGRSLLSWPDALIVNSTAAAEHIARRPGAARRVFVSPNVIDLPDFDRRCREARGASPVRRPCAMLVGRLVPAKSGDRFLEALALARRTEPTLAGLVVGDGPERGALEVLARELGLWPEAVQFLGQREDIPALLSQATMLLLTSDQEGFPNVLLEAMAARLPVITTPAGDAARIVRDGSTGYVVSLSDLAGLAARMVDLVRSPALAQALGREGRRVVEAEYGSEALAPRLLEIYADMAGVTGRAALRALLAA